MAAASMPARGLAPGAALPVAEKPASAKNRCAVLGGEVHLVAAARPNLPKLAALWHALRTADPPLPLRPVLLHTGQHHDRALFHVHLEDLGLPPPDLALDIHGGGHAALTGHTMMACAGIWQRRRPALVVVAGDVDGTLAAALAARKLGLPVAHLEAGLRCGDADMPEEINRRAVDAISTLLWAPDEASALRLIAQGATPAATRAVGNAMIDSLHRSLAAALARPLPLPLPQLEPQGEARGGISGRLQPGGYGVVTLHRAANVDDPLALAGLLDGLAQAAELLPLVWPLHPRTAARLQALGRPMPRGIWVLPPLGYMDFLGLLARARLVATDSGGVQEEAAGLGLPCFTLRPSTERPVTLGAGNQLVAPAALAAAVAATVARVWGDPARGGPGFGPEFGPEFGVGFEARQPTRIPLWDGLAGSRMVAHLRDWLEGDGAEVRGIWAA